MAQPEQDKLKDQVRDFWNEQSCDTQVAKASKFSHDYFEEIERFRYFDQPFIHSFAQFSRYHGKRVVEVGFGAGTDFIGWLRAGARASGIDLTQEALDSLRQRIAVYRLPEPETIQVGDAENLPFDSNQFDLGYSFGVLHHTPNTEKAVAELIRVVRPGGEIKMMLYNRHSIYAVNLWIKHALLRGQPWKSLRGVLWHNMESVGTKGYTRSELERLLSSLPLEQIQIHTEITAADYLSASAFPPLNLFFRTCLRLAGSRFGWHPSHYVERVNAPGKRARAANARGDSRRAKGVLMTGNRWGFFHCISARKAERPSLEPAPI